MLLNLSFKSPDYVYYEAGQNLSGLHNGYTSYVKVEPEDINEGCFKVTILSETINPKTDSKIILPPKLMRIENESSDKILLREIHSDLDPNISSNFGLTINFKKNEIYNCILHVYHKNADYKFLNDSELTDPRYSLNFELMQPDKNGIFTERMLNRERIEWTFINNEKHGIWKGYYASGGLKEIGTYEHGKAVGEWKSYWEDRILKGSGFYKNGYKTGLWKFYTTEGVLSVESTYVNEDNDGDWLYRIEKNEAGTSLLRNIDLRFLKRDKSKLYFADTGGAGNIVCKDCGFTQKITCHLHTLPSSIKMTTVVIGYQCQLCGKFQTRRSTPQQRVIEDLKCDCGGEIDNEKPIFCPKCKSFNITYQLTFLT